MTDIYHKNPYFISKEFDSPDRPGSGLRMNATFLNMLTIARSVSNTPYIINSGYRTEKYNLYLKGTKTSLHKKGLAADIKCTHPIQRHSILKGLILAGFNEIGIYDSHIHAAMDIVNIEKIIYLSL